MKLNLKTIGLAALMAFVAVNAHAEVATATSSDGMCELINKFKEIFSLLRTFAFVGAAFTMAGWAWGFISSGKVDKPLDDVKGKGFSLLIGCFLLFGVGIILTLVLNAAAPGGTLMCGDIIQSW